MSFKLIQAQQAQMNFHKVGKVLLKFHQLQVIKQQLTMVLLDIPTNTLHIIGIVYSAVGVALSVISCFFFKIHSRALDYIQWGYFLAVIMHQYAYTFPFSLNMEVGSSLIALSDKSLLNFFCPMGIYVCQRPFALSFLVILCGFLVLMSLITIPQKVRDIGLTFERVYRLFKGLFKWFYLPLMFESLYLLINGLITVKSSLIPSVVILVVLIVFPIVQVILYGLFDQKEDPLIKWFELANYIKAGMFALLIVLVLRFGNFSYFYYLALIYISYAGFFAFKYNFRFPIFGRILYIGGEVIFYFLYSLYVSGALWLQKYYYIDLFGIGLILLIDIIFYIAEGTAVYKQWRSNVAGVEILPENSKDGINKKNKYEYEVGEEIVRDVDRYQSRDNLNQSKAESSVKKSPSKNRLK